MTTTIFAANWKMHHGPSEAREFLSAFLSSYEFNNLQQVWLFPPTVALEAVAGGTADRPDITVGAQNVHWEEKGAFTGELSVAMAADVGARAALVGHSERRHVFGETDQETGSKVRALLRRDMRPVFCVGETLGEREADQTMSVVHRQLGALEGLDRASLSNIVVAYEPVWAIGTGKTATPGDAATVHRGIRDWFANGGVKRDDVSVLYGGSVKPDNARALLSEPEIDGVLVGGASLDPNSWREICRAASID